MTVKTLLAFTTGPVEIRSGRRSLFAKIRPNNVRDHLKEEVWKIEARGTTLIVYCSVPDYELDVDVDVDYPTEDDLPWD